MAKNIIPYADLKKRGVPFTRGYIHKLEKTGRFPRHVTISEARVGWLEEDIDNWIDGLKERRDAEVPTEAHARTAKARAARTSRVRKIIKRSSAEAR